LPERVTRHLVQPVDIFNFGFASKLLQAASIPRAAQKLGSDIERYFPNKTRIFFVTHSTGGLVVRDFLNLDRVQLGDPAADDVYQVVEKSKDYLQSRWWKSVSIINFDVPHDGGNAPLTWFAQFAQGLGVGPATAVLGFPYNLVQGMRKKRFYHLGFNRILLQLHPWSPTLRRIGSQFTAHRDQLIHRRFPVPHSLEVLARQGFVINDERRETLTAAGGRVDKPETRETYVLAEGDHFTVKESQSDGPDDPVVMLITREINERGSRPRQAEIAAKSFRELILRQHARIDRLIGETDVAPDAMLGKAAAGARTQAQIHRHIMSDLNAGNGLRAAVTGPAGTGKSTVLRCVAREVCAAALREPGREGCIPIFLQLRDYSLPQPEGSGSRPLTARRLMLYLGAQWLAFANAAGASQERAVDGCWLRRRLRTGLPVLFLDSLDEFVNRHREMTVELVEEALGLTVALAEGQIDVLLSWRDSFAADLQGYEVRRLELPDAETLGRELPWMKPILDQAPGDDILRVPLIAKQLAGQAHQDVDWRHSGRTDLLSIILDSLITPQVGRQPSRLANDEGIPRDTERLALGLAARVLFDNLGKPMHAEKIREGMQLLVRGIQAQAVGDVGSRSIDKVAELLEDGDAFKRMLSYTIFTPINTLEAFGRGRQIHWKIYHTEIEAFLVSQFVSDTVTAGYFDPLGTRAHTTDIFLMAGRLLQQRQFVLDAPFVNRILARTLEQKNWFIIGNLAVIFGNSEIQFGRGGADEISTAMAVPPRLADGSALNDTGAARQLADCDDPGIVTTGRMIILLSWARRVIMAQPSDIASRVLREQLFAEHGPVNLVDILKSPETDRVSESLYWCALKLMGTSADAPAPKIGPSPELGRDEGDVRVAAALISSVDSDRLQDRHLLSYELGFLKYATLIADNGASHVIELTTAVHYSFIIASAAYLNQSRLNPGELVQVVHIVNRLDELGDSGSEAMVKTPRDKQVLNYLTSILGHIKTRLQL
jgi:hypothetical protein